jgi:hypothetical protein
MLTPGPRLPRACACRSTMEVGLLFPSMQAKIDLDRPAGGRPNEPLLQLEGGSALLRLRPHWRRRARPLAFGLLFSGWHSARAPSTSRSLSTSLHPHPAHAPLRRPCPNHRTPLLPALLLLRPDGRYDATRSSEMMPEQRTRARQLHDQAQTAWWSVGHPGWTLCTLNSDSFVQVGAARALRRASGTGGPGSARPERCALGKTGAVAVTRSPA